jgi:hypothetical protein
MSCKQLILIHKGTKCKEFLNSTALSYIFSIHRPQVSASHPWNKLMMLFVRMGGAQFHLYKLMKKTIDSKSCHAAHSLCTGDPLQVIQMECSTKNLTTL